MTFSQTVDIGVLADDGAQSTRVWSENMLEARQGPSTVALQDGRVLVVGGMNEAGDPIDDAEIHGA